MNVNNLIADAARKNSSQIADLNRSQLLRSERDDKSKIQNKLNGRTRYAPNPKNSRKGRVGETYTLFDKGAFHKGIKAVIKGDKIESKGTDFKTPKLKAIYDDSGSIIGFQADSAEEARRIIREDLRMGLRKALIR